jgi:hypothetical protein
VTGSSTVPTRRHAQPGAALHSHVRRSRPRLGSALSTPTDAVQPSARFVAIHGDGRSRKATRRWLSVAAMPRAPLTPLQCRGPARTVKAQTAHSPGQLRLAVSASSPAPAELAATSMPAEVGSTVDVEWRGQTESRSAPIGPDRMDAITSPPHQGPSSVRQCCQARATSSADG